MAGTKITKMPPVGNIDSQRNSRRIYNSSYSPDKDYYLIAVIYSSIPTPNVPKNTFASSVFISETPQKYSKQNSPNTAHVSLK